MNKRIIIIVRASKGTTVYTGVWQKKKFRIKNSCPFALIDSRLYIRRYNRNVNPTLYKNETRNLGRLTNSKITVDYHHLGNMQRGV